MEIYAPGHHQYHHHPHEHVSVSCKKYRSGVAHVLRNQQQQSEIA